MSSTSPKTTVKKTTTPPKTKTARRTTTKTKRSTTAKAARRTSTKSKATAAKPATANPVTSATPLSPVPPAPLKNLAEPVAVPEPVAASSTPELRKKELIDIVIDKVGGKKKDVKPVVEALLEVLGDTVADGRDLNLPPFAKLRIQRVKQMPTARVSVAKLRQARPTLPDAAE